MLLVSSQVLRAQTLPACSNGVLFSSSGYPGFQAATYASRSYTGIAPGYTYQFPGEWSSLLCFLLCLQVMGVPGMIYNPGSAPFTLSPVWSFFKLEMDVEGGWEKPWNRWEQPVLH